MLVLTRKTDESLVIDGKIVITILGIEGERVKIGISAPQDVKIHRKELWEAISEQTHIAESLAQDGDNQSIQKLRQFLAEEMPAESQAQTSESAVHSP
jgi:carbon storage regulator